MKEFKFTRTVTVKQEEIDDFLVAAFEGGITYWCEGVRVKKEADEPTKYFSGMLTRGAILELRDEEGWHELTLKNVIKAMQEENIDFDNYDADNADVVVQKAIFGELVYG